MKTLDIYTQQDIRDLGGQLGFSEEALRCAVAVGDLPAASPEVKQEAIQESLVLLRRHQEARGICTVFIGSGMLGEIRMKATRRELLQELSRGVVLIDRPIRTLTGETRLLPKKEGPEYTDLVQQALDELFPLTP